MKNKGIFTVITVKDENEKFQNVIVYIEKGVERYLDKYMFDSYPEAADYLKNNKKELDAYVTELKEIERKEAEEAERLRKEQEEKEKEEKAQKEEQNKKRKYDSKRFIAGFLAAVIVLTSGHFIGKGISASRKDKKEDEITLDEEENEAIEIKDENVLDSKFREYLVSKKIISCEVLENNTVLILPLKTELNSEEIAEIVKEFFNNDLFKEILGELDTEITELTDEEKINYVVNYLKSIGINLNTININQDIENIVTAAEELSTENFEELVANFAKPYVDNNLSVSTEDLTKFAAIMLIDRLAEENPVLVQELFGVQSEEEFLNDAGKVIGVTYMYNHQIFETEKSTDNFIWISSGIQDGDSQKEAMLLIEDYVRRIGEAVVADDKEKVQEITNELINELTSPTGRLNALDDGTEFAAQVYFALINNSLARNYLTQEQRDYFNVRSTSETNISNILTVISGCKSESKSRTLTQ